MGQHDEISGALTSYVSYRKVLLSECTEGFFIARGLASQCPEVKELMKAARHGGNCLEATRTTFSRFALQKLIKELHDSGAAQSIASVCAV